MQRLIVFILLLFSSSLMARDVLPYYESEREMLLRSNYKFEGNRTKTYDSTKTIEFEIYCSKWFETKYASDIIDSLKRCSLISKATKSNCDSTVRNQGEYQLFERIYDAEGHIAYYSFFEWHSTTIDRYESGRLVSTEDWCDTVKKDGDPLCLSLLEKRTFSIKPDSLGLFLRNQTRYVWDKKGRLKQRIIWDMGNPYGLNGTYEFIYKSPCDTIRVVPEDRVWGWDGAIEGRYDGSFGKIPEMGDPEYENFAAAPYSFRQSEELLERQKKRCADYKKSLKKK